MPGTSIPTCAGRTTAGSHLASERRHLPEGVPLPELLGAELPEPAQHVDGVERPVGQLDAPGKGIPVTARAYLAQQPPGQVPGERPGDIQSNDPRVVVRGVEDLP